MSSEAKKTLERAKKIAVDATTEGTMNPAFTLGQIIFELNQALSALEAERGDDKQKLWDIAHVQDTPELEEAFLVNWLRGEIKIPQRVKDRIIIAAQPHPPAVAGDRAEALKACDFIWDDAKNTRKARTTGDAHELYRAIQTIRAALTPPDADLAAVRDALEKSHEALRRSLVWECISGEEETRYKIERARESNRKAFAILNQMIEGK